MNELRPLLERYWISKEDDKVAYYAIRRSIPQIRNFVRDQLGWRLISNERLVKLEKIPAHGERFMGIMEFHEVRDYCILCAVLIYLEDREEEDQFLLSELVDFITVQMSSFLACDWTSFSQRKSLVRVLKYVESMGMVRVYEGDSDSFSTSAGQEVLYENTGLSRYFATTFAADIKSLENVEDFEAEAMADADADTSRGHYRVHRVYRQLVCCPAMYWSGNEDADGIYLKNQRQTISNNLEHYLGGRLDIHKNAAFWMVEEDDAYGKVHPRDAMEAELAALICGEIRERIAEQRLKVEESGVISISDRELTRLILDCRERDREAWSKEYRQMEETKLLNSVKSYLSAWMMIRRQDEGWEIMPGAVKTVGAYPKDYLERRELQDGKPMEDE